jgi:hypothetical protein
MRGGELERREEVERVLMLKALCLGSAWYSRSRTEAVSERAIAPRERTWRAVIWRLVSRNINDWNAMSGYDFLMKDMYELTATTLKEPMTMERQPAATRSRQNGIPSDF